MVISLGLGWLKSTYFSAIFQGCLTAKNPLSQISHIAASQIQFEEGRKWPN